MFDYGKFKSMALTVIGTIMLTTVSVGAAVAPARQVETATYHYLAATGGSAKLA